MNNLSISIKNLRREKCSLIRDVILTVITFGLWNLYIQYRQIHFVNKIRINDGVPSVLFILILSICTFGLYFCYHEYKMTKKLHVVTGYKDQEIVEILAAVITFIGLWFIVDLYQQYLINLFVESNETAVIPETTY